jgi:hypothetical protein
MTAPDACSCGLPRDSKRITASCRQCSARAIAASPNTSERNYVLMHATSDFRAMVEIETKWRMQRA